MNQRQVTSIILSVLLASTLAHEYVQHHYLSHEARAVHGHSRKHQEGKAHHAIARSALLSHHTRSNHQHFRTDDEDCTWVCDNNGNTTTVDGSLTVIIKKSISLIIVANTSAEVAIGFDLEAGLVILLQGKTGNAIVINVETQIGYLIKGGIWESSKNSIEEFVENLKGCQSIWDIGVKSGTRFDIKASVNKEISKLTVAILVSLGIEIAGAAAVGITVLIEIATAIVIKHKEVILFLIKSAASAAINIQGGLQHLVGVIAAISKLLGQIEGGIKGLIEKKIELDIAAILKASNGIKVLVEILIQLAGKIDISALLGELVKTSADLLGLLAELGGKVAKGVTGVIVIIHQIIVLAQKESSDVSVLIKALIEFSASLDVHVDIRVELEASVQALITVLKKDGSEVSVGIIKIIESITKNQLVVGGVNIGHIIEILVKGAAKGVLVLVVEVLVTLKVVVDIVQTIPRLVLGLLELLQSVVGIEILVKVIPSIKIPDSAISGGTVKVSVIITENISITSIITSGFHLDAILDSLPVIKDIAKVLRAALETVTKGTVKLTDTIKSNSSIKTAIIVWIKSSLGIKISSKESSIAKGVTGGGGSIGGGIFGGGGIIGGGGKIGGGGDGKGNGGGGGIIGGGGIFGGGGATNATGDSNSGGDGGFHIFRHNHHSNQRHHHEAGRHH